MSFLKCLKVSLLTPKHLGNEIFELYAYFRVKQLQLKAYDILILKQEQTF